MAKVLLLYNAPVLPVDHPDAESEIRARFGFSASSYYRTLHLVVANPAAEAYDRRDAGEDLNLVFPLQRLRELEAEGVVGRVAEEHYGFGLAPHPAPLLASAGEVAGRLTRAQVDLVLLVPA